MKKYTYLSDNILNNAKKTQSNHYWVTLKWYLLGWHIVRCFHHINTIQKAGHMTHRVNYNNYVSFSKLLLSVLV